MADGTIAGVFSKFPDRKHPRHRENHTKIVLPTVGLC